MTYAGSVGNMNTTVDYSKLLEQMYAQQQAKATQGTVATNPVTTSNTVTEDTYVPSKQSTETCTDGKDDGKIGFWNGVGQFFKGAAKGLVNGVKGMFLDENGKFSLKNTLKTALTIGACFIPVAGPYIAAGLCVVGAVKGGAGMIKSISNAAKAETDAEKKEALQSLGGNTLTTGLSVAGLKGATGAIARQSGFTSVLGKTNSIRSSIVESGVRATAKQMGSSFTNYYGTAWQTGVASAKGATTMSRVASGTKAVIKEGAKGTAQNAISAGKAIKNKATETYNKLSSNHGAGTADQVAHSLGKKVTATDVQNAVQNGGELTVGKGKLAKTYTIKDNGGGNYSFELNKTAKTVKTGVESTKYYSKENAVDLQENVSLENLDKSGFTSSEISKIENLKTNHSYTTKNGVKVTRTADGYSSTQVASGTKTTVYENISADKLSKIVGKDLATDINTQLTANQYLGVADDAIYVTGKNGAQYYYEPATNTLTKCSNASATTAGVHEYISNKTADVNTFISEAPANAYYQQAGYNYDYTPFIADLTDEM